MDKYVPIRKVDDEKHLVFGEVYVPQVLDSQGDFMTEVEIEKMAHAFMRNGRVSKIDTEHDAVMNGSHLVESFIARPSDPDFIPGSWVVGVHIPEDDIWDQVKKGELNGFSMFGASKRTTQELEIEIPDDGILKGDTEISDDHTHGYRLEFSVDGDFLGGATDIVNGHFHTIKKGTATEKADGHVHRYSFLEGIV